MVMKKEMNFPVAFKLKAFIYHNFLFWKPLFVLPMESSKFDGKKLEVGKQTSN